MFAWKVEFVRATRAPPPSTYYDDRYDRRSPLPPRDRYDSSSYRSDDRDYRAPYPPLPPPTSTSTSGSRYGDRYDDRDPRRYERRAARGGPTPGVGKCYNCGKDDGHW
jgi:hypothetical protein